ncbi:phosphatidate cytidylyltransferase [Psychromonas sp. CNPT3]|uniref:phosphatidate cytidylyltransferase n=1 Tax=Psychromonas sp. CNPT3 TaxID=314282 RepID=UPI00006E8941|nr:phosphatidate cytidylyltransferase [Psychromonas sp. CNPT3]AGH81982.1 phosphatidate cytidylyltransferase [Psychromonas sp. CNPT3]
MKQRIITALILAPLAIAGIFLLPLKFFMLFCTVIYLLASKEWVNFVTEKSHWVLYFLALVLGVSLVFIPAESLWQATGVSPILMNIVIAGGVWWVVALLKVVTYPRSATIWKNSKALKVFFGVCTLLPFFWAMVILRSVNMYHDFYYGAQLLMFVFLLVWAADTGAYFVGKRFGKHKLAIKVSPGKTIEGFLGGVVCSMLITLLASLYFDISSEKMPVFFIAAFVTCLVSTLGDLSESVFKREAGLKDSGSLLPGHGGILDRIDSLTAAVPVFTLMYITWIM